MAQNPYQLIDLSNDIVLSWPFSFQGGPVIADLNNVIPTAGTFSITLPDATLASNGQNFMFNNISVYPFELLASDGMTSVVTIGAGEIYYIYLTDNSTSNGIWVPVPFGGGTNSITSVTAQSADGSIVINNPSLTPPGGTINFSLPDSISNLNDLTITGFPVITSASPLTWNTRELLGGENITISNGNGVSSEPIIDLNPALTSLGSVSLLGGLVLSGNLVTTSVVNGSVEISSAGAGAASINGISIDTSSNITGINNLTVNGSFTNPRTPKVLFTFTDTLVGENAGIVIQDVSNVSTITNTGDGTYTITFSTPLTSTNYGVFLGLGSTGGVAPLVRHAYWTVKNVNSVVIVIVDSSGVPVVEVPNGVTGMIMLST